VKGMLYPLLAAVAVGVLSGALTPYDATDHAVNGKRSGMLLYTDYGTGCQYLSAGTFGGGLTPRLDGRGRHVGCHGGVQ